MILLALVAAAGCAMSENYFLFLLPLGFILGLCIGRLDHFREGKATWAAIDEVIDWNRVGALLEQAETD